jgi:hypothetical protein
MSSGTFSILMSKEDNNICPLLGPEGQSSKEFTTMAKVTEQLPIRMRDQIEPVLHLHKLESIESMKSVFCLIKHTWKRSDCHECIHHLHDMQTNIYIY